MTRICLPVCASRVRASRACAVVFVVLTACGSGGEPDYLTADELMDAETCKQCHPKHYREWSGSMHAYAADDPVFIAMNRRGQEETNGSLGDFCIGCHAPVAVALGRTTDGLNLEELPQSLKGVTCYFCHSVAEVTDDHNNPLVLATDQVLRGGISDPIENGVHRTGYSALHDSRSFESSKLCGACHDIVTPAGVHLERTFKEWRESVFGKPAEQGGLSCGSCHMPITPGTVAEFDGVPLRNVREHSWPGVDVALTDWPEKAAQLEGIERDLFSAVLPTLCVNPSGGGVQVQYKLDNVFAGHSLPSGAAQDRRMWAELTVYRGTEIVLQTGHVAENEAVATAAESDSLLWQIRDFASDENGDVAHMFWDVRDVRSELLAPGVTNDRSDPRFNHSMSKFFDVIGDLPTRVTARVHIRPIGFDVMDDVIGSGHLDSVFRDRIPTFTLDGTELEWTEARGFGCVDRTTN